MAALSMLRHILKTVVVVFLLNESDWLAIWFVMANAP